MTFTPPSQQVFIAISYFADFFLTVYWTANTRMNILPDYSTWWMGGSTLAYTRLENSLKHE